MTPNQMALALALINRPDMGNKEKAAFLAQSHKETARFERFIESGAYRTEAIQRLRQFRGLSEDTIRREYATVGVGPLSKAEKKRRRKKFFDRYYDDARRNRRNRLGNSPTEGHKFRGRGGMQLTGREGYEEAGRDLNIDLVNKPWLAGTPEASAKTALWFWDKKVKPRVKRRTGQDTVDYSDTREITRAVKGGTSTHEERHDLYLKYYNEMEHEKNRIKKERMNYYYKPSKDKVV